MKGCFFLLTVTIWYKKRAFSPLYSVRRGWNDALKQYYFYIVPSGSCALMCRVTAVTHQHNAKCALWKSNASSCLTKDASFSAKYALQTWEQLRNGLVCLKHTDRSLLLFYHATYVLQSTVWWTSSRYVACVNWKKREFYAAHPSTNDTHCIGYFSQYTAAATN